MICSFYSGAAEKVDHSCYVQVGFLLQQTQFDQRKAMDIYLDDITNLTDNFDRPQKEIAHLVCTRKKYSVYILSCSYYSEQIIMQLIHHRLYMGSPQHYNDGDILLSTTVALHKGYFTLSERSIALHDFHMMPITYPTDIKSLLTARQSTNDILF